MKLFNRVFKKDLVIKQLQEEVAYLQSRVDNSEEYFKELYEQSNEVIEYVDEIKSITDVELQEHKLRLLSMEVRSLRLTLINQSQDRIGAELKKGRWK
jgi:hypothetical protein